MKKSLIKLCPVLLRCYSVFELCLSVCFNNLPGSFSPLIPQIRDRLKNHTSVVLLRLLQLWRDILNRV